MAGTLRDKKSIPRGFYRKSLAAISCPSLLPRESPESVHAKKA